MRAGQVIGAYQLVRSLGEGGTSEVWLAEHQRLKCLRALKAQKLDVTIPSHRMVNEARVQAVVHHPNVVTVHDIFDHAGRPVIVQDFVEGMELADLLTFPMRPALLERILRDILSGLAALHAEGIVHRDLKPANIIVTPGGRACIVDLGIARQDGLPGRTRTGALMGTPAFMAPEQADDATAADIRSDLFAVGCIALTLLTGGNPFHRDTLRETLAAVHQCDAIREEALDGCTSHGPAGRIASLIRRTVVYDRDARLPTAQHGHALLWSGVDETLETLVPERADTQDRRERTIVLPRPSPTMLGALGAVSGAALAAATLLALVGAWLSMSLAAREVAVARAPVAPPVAAAIPVVNAGGALESVERTERPAVEDRDDRGLLRRLLHPSRR